MCICVNVSDSEEDICDKYFFYSKTGYFEYILYPCKVSGTKNQSIDYFDYASTNVICFSCWGVVKHSFVKSSTNVETNRHSVT